MNEDDYAQQPQAPQRRYVKPLLYAAAIAGALGLGAGYLLLTVARPDSADLQDVVDKKIDRVQDDLNDAKKTLKDLLNLDD